MNEIIVGRHIEGISLNDLEYLLDENGEIMKFPTEQHAIRYLKEHGADDGRQGREGDLDAADFDRQ